MNKLLLVLLAAYVAAGSASPLQPANCSDDKISCGVVKIYRNLIKAAQSKDIEIYDGVTFVRDKSTAYAGRSLQKSESEIMKELPTDMSDRMIKLLTMLYDAGSSFLNSHSLSLKLSKESVSRALDEGRAKLKKLWPMLSILAVKLITLPLITGVLFLIFKAVILGKIALAIASFAAFEKFFGANKVTDSNVNQNVPPAYLDNVAANWFANSGHQHPGYRGLDVTDAKIDAHNLAYSAHAPVPHATK